MDQDLEKELQGIRNELRALVELFMFYIYTSEMKAFDKTYIIDEKKRDKMRENLHNILNNIAYGEGRKRKQK